MKPQSAKRLCAAMLIPLAVLLTGCGASLPISAVECPVLPTLPSVATPTPQVSYSQNAQKNIERWQKSLTDSIQSGKP